MKKQTADLVAIATFALLASTCSGAGELQPAQSRLGMNLSGAVEWNTEHPFMDVFRLSRRWISQRHGAGWGKGPELELDARGWVKKLEPDCYAETPILTSGHAPDGDYVCLYEGEGQVEFGPKGKLVSRQPGRLVVTIDGHGGASSKWGSWCLLEGADETASPKFDAVMEWNRRNPRDRDSPPR